MRVLTVTLDTEGELITINVREHAQVVGPDGTVLQLGEVTVRRAWVFACVINSEPKLLRVLPATPKRRGRRGAMDMTDVFGTSVQFWYDFVRSGIFRNIVKWNVSHGR